MANFEGMHSNLLLLYRIYNIFKVWIIQITFNINKTISLLSVSINRIQLYDKLARNCASMNLTIQLTREGAGWRENLILKKFFYTNILKTFLFIKKSYA